MIVKKDNILRQDNLALLNTFENIRNGNLDNYGVNFVMSACLDKLTLEEQNSFDEAIHLVPV